MSDGDSMAMYRPICWLRGHDWSEHLYLRPRPGTSPPAPMKHRVCGRCGYAPECNPYCGRKEPANETMRMRNAPRLGPIEALKEAIRRVR